MHDLLNDPLIGIRTMAGAARVSLPELFARLSSGKVEGYTGLRPHQADPWHVFLVQLAASILARHPEIPSANPPVDVEFWRAGLLDLAEGKATAWHLIVEDVTLPAFFQHPLASESEFRDHYKLLASAPDQLETELLVSAKRNHDLKLARCTRSDIEAWIYALATLQTTRGYLLHYSGVIRMNSGHGSKPAVSVVVTREPSGRFREELRIVCEMRPKTISGYGFRDAGITLTWLSSWNRNTHQYNLTDLEPWFVEATQPIRLCGSFESFAVMSATDYARQIGPKSLNNGDVGDPWIPLNVADKKKGQSALTVSEKGWTPELLSNLLFQKGYRLTSLQTPRTDSSDLWFIGSVLVRGQGTTGGFHRFEIPVPAKASGWLIAAHKRETLGELAQDLIKAAKAADKALSAALMALAKGDPEKQGFDAKTIAKWVEKAKEALTRGWEDRFFKTLWRAADENIDRVRRDWEESLVELASQILRDAEGALPMPHARRYRALVAADRILFGSLKKSGLIQIDTEEVAS